AKLSTHPPSSNGIRLSVIRRPKTTAVPISNMIIAVVLSVSKSEFLKPSQLNVLVKIVRNKTPPAPMTPASVGVNHPANNPPIDSAKMIATSQSPPLRDLNLLCEVDLPPRGES